MKPAARSIESSRFYGDGAGIRKHLRRAAVGILAVVSLVFASANAFATCGVVAGAKSAGIKLPSLVQSAPQVAGLLAQVEGGASNTFVGLWQTRYTTGGAVFAVSFKQWHSDGTELDNIDQNPALGSVCVGVWKQTGLRSVDLHHVGWVFNPDGSPGGSFTIDESDTLAENGKTYTGTFTFRTFDVNGSPTGVEVSGNVAANRITVN